MISAEQTAEAQDRRLKPTMYESIVVMQVFRRYRSIFNKRDCLGVSFTQLVS